MILPISGRLFSVNKTRITSDLASLTMTKKSTPNALFGLRLQFRLHRDRVIGMSVYFLHHFWIL